VAHHSLSGDHGYNLPWLDRNGLFLQWSVSFEGGAPDGDLPGANRNRITFALYTPSAFCRCIDTVFMDAHSNAGIAAMTKSRLVCFRDRFSLFFLSASRERCCCPCASIVDQSVQFRICVLLRWNHSDAAADHHTGGGGNKRAPRAASMGFEAIRKFFAEERFVLVPWALVTTSFIAN